MKTATNKKKIRATGFRARMQTKHGVKALNRRRAISRKIV